MTRRPAGYDPALVEALRASVEGARPGVVSDAAIVALLAAPQVNDSGGAPQACGARGEHDEAGVLPPAGASSPPLGGSAGFGLLLPAESLPPREVPRLPRFPRRMVARATLATRGVVASGRSGPAWGETMAVVGGDEDEGGAA